MDIFESLENLNVSEECFDEIMDMVEELLEGYNLRDTVRNVQGMAYKEMQQERGKKNPQYKILDKLKELTKSYADRTGVKDDHYLGDNLEKAAMNQRSDSDFYNNKIYQPDYQLTAGKDAYKGVSKNQHGENKTTTRRNKKYINK